MTHPRPVPPDQPTGSSANPPPDFTCVVRPGLAPALGSFIFWGLAMVVAAVLITMVSVSGSGAPNHTTLLAMICVGVVMLALQPVHARRVFGRRAVLELRHTSAGALLTVNLLNVGGRVTHSECFEALQEVRCERRDLSGDRFELRLAKVRPDGKTVGLFTSSDRRYRFFHWTEAQLRQVVAALNAGPRSGWTAAAGRPSEAGEVAAAPGRDQTSPAKENTASGPQPVD